MAKKFFDTAEIPEHRRNDLADLALEITASVFAIPGEEEKYQKWLSERKAKNTVRKDKT